MSIDPALIPPPPALDQPLEGARPSLETLALLAQRRSTKSMLLGKPGPSDAQLDAMLRLAARVPDHGKLGPWRFVILAGDARARLGVQLANVIAHDPGVDAGRIELERNRYMHAPVCVMVVSSVGDTAKIPEWEQRLSAGAACFALLVSAHAMGFAGTWLTEWPVYDPRARSVLGLKDGEHVAGFIHVGTPTQYVTERARPDLAGRISRL